LKVTIYSDGGADPNPGYGGWGAVLIYGKHEKKIKGNAKDTTNNRMELSAAIGALKTLTRPCEVDFYTDSQYLRRGITEWIEGWAAANFKRKGEPIPNSDLWKKLNPLIQPHQITWNWVKGHSGNHYNEIVDKLATEARLEVTPQFGVEPNLPTLFVRGSCRGNPGPGGWAFILTMPNGKVVKKSGTQPSTTNNRMEIEAALQGLESISKDTVQVQVITVSDYLFMGATQWINGWKKRNWVKKGGDAVSNTDLWQRIDQQGQNLNICWLNGKNTEIKGNELAETAKMAGDASKGSS
jgi:ribonuclease HI